MSQGRTVPCRDVLFRAGTYCAMQGRTVPCRDVLFRGTYDHSTEKEATGGGKFIENTRSTVNSAHLLLLHKCSLLYFGSPT
jgi:hypothetical protein